MGFPLLKETFPFVSYTSFFIPLVLNSVAEVSILSIYIYSMQTSQKHIVDAIEYTSLQSSQKSPDAEGKRTALTIIQACVIYTKLYTGDDCTLLDCIIVMQHPSQKGV